MMLATWRLARLGRQRLAHPSLSTSAVARREEAKPFRSAINPDSYLYPGTSGADRFQNPDVQDVLGSLDVGPFSGFIPPSQLQMTYTNLEGRVTGDRVADYRVDLRFHLDSADWLSPETKARVHGRWGRDLTRDGYVVIKSGRTRSAMMNQAEALRKLREAIWAALAAEVPASPIAQKAEVRRKRQIAAARFKAKEPRISA